VIWIHKCFEILFWTLAVYLSTTLWLNHVRSACTAATSRRNRNVNIVMLLLKNELFIIVNNYSSSSLIQRRLLLVLVSCENWCLWYGSLLQSSDVRISLRPTTSSCIVTVIGTPQSRVVLATRSVSGRGTWVVRMTAGCRQQDFTSTVWLTTALSRYQV